jgi:hypothetical protein
MTTTRERRDPLEVPGRFARRRRADVDFALQLPGAKKKPH